MSRERDKPESMKNEEELNTALNTLSLTESERDKPESMKNEEELNTALNTQSLTESERDKPESMKNEEELNTALNTQSLTESERDKPESMKNEEELNPALNTQSLTESERDKPESMKNEEELNTALNTLSLTESERDKPESMKNEEELNTALNTQSLTEGDRFKLRSDKYNMAASSTSTPNNSRDEDSDSSDDEKFNTETRRELMAAHPRLESAPRLERSDSADLVLLRAGNSPHNNQFLYVHSCPGGELDLRMGFVDPLVGGCGVFKQTKKLDEVTMKMAYTYTNLRFDKAIGVEEGTTPTVMLMEPPQSPVSSSDPRMFSKRTEERHCFRLQSLLLKDWSLAYTNDGTVELTKRGSLFTEREGNPVDEMDSVKPHPIVVEYNPVSLVD